MKLTLPYALDLSDLQQNQGLQYRRPCLHGRCEQASTFRGFSSFPLFCLVQRGRPRDFLLPPSRSLCLSSGSGSSLSLPKPLQDFRTSALSRFQSSSGIAPPVNTAVILYAYDETPINKINLLFFVEHGLHNNADFVFILNGPTTIEKMIPRAENIKILRRPKNACYGIGVYGQALKANQGLDYKSYKHFIMLSSEVRGPFVPHWSSACWSEAYLSKVTEKVKVSSFCNAFTFGIQADSLPV